MKTQQTTPTVEAEADLSMADAVRSLGMHCKLKGKQVLVIACRQNWMGDVLSVSDTCLYLKNAIFAADTGSFESDKVDTWQPLPDGLAVISLSAVECLTVGKIPQTK